MTIYPDHESLSTDLGRADEAENGGMAFPVCLCLFELPSWSIIPSGAKCSLI